MITVSVGIAVMPGVYVEPAIRNGVGVSLDDNYIVRVPAGDYSIIMVGINWGSIWIFAVDVDNGTSGGNSRSGSGASAIGTVWFPAAVTMSVPSTIAQ